ncbi:hypothetical protein HanRHA438_Chr12g0570301 [Helianthus annuus]|nr:hypothetical protein HanRHA438_Chr12g0570301 [Helianthus annuus]
MLMLHYIPIVIIHYIDFSFNHKVLISKAKLFQKATHRKTKALDFLNNPYHG